jgi:hypothetical protein
MAAMQRRRPKVRAKVEEKVLVRHVAGHFAMGASLGTAGALVLLLNNTGAIRDLLASGGPHAMSTAVFVGMCACTIAIGATLTGIIFSATDER